MSDIEIIKKYYGLTTLQAKEYKKNVSKTTIELIKNSYKNECKKLFTMIKKNKIGGKKK